MCLCGGTDYLEVKFYQLCSQAGFESDLLPTSYNTAVQKSRISDQIKHFALTGAVS